MADELSSTAKLWAQYSSRVKDSGLTMPKAQLAQSLPAEPPAAAPPPAADARPPVPAPFEFKGVPIASMGARSGAPAAPEPGPAEQTEMKVGIDLNKEHELEEDPDLRNRMDEARARLEAAQEAPPSVGVEDSIRDFQKKLTQLIAALDDAVNKSAMVADNVAANASHQSDMHAHVLAPTRPLRLPHGYHFPSGASLMAAVSKNHEVCAKRLKETQDISDALAGDLKGLVSRALALRKCTDPLFRMLSPGSS